MTTDYAGTMALQGAVFLLHLTVILILGGLALTLIRIRRPDAWVFFLVAAIIKLFALIGPAIATPVLFRIVQPDAASFMMMSINFVFGMIATVAWGFLLYGVIKLTRGPEEEEQAR